MPLLLHRSLISSVVEFTKSILERLIEGRTNVSTDILKHLNVALNAGTYYVVLKLEVIVLFKNRVGIETLIVEVSGALSELLSRVGDRTDLTVVMYLSLILVVRYGSSRSGGGCRR